MYPKLLAIVLVFGVVACVLLVNRQQRIEAAREMTLIYRRLDDQERAIWRLRAEIARHCSPDQLRLVRERLGPEWEPIVLSDRLRRRIHGRRRRAPLPDLDPPGRYALDQPEPDPDPNPNAENLGG